jgi:hypothetical protein
MGKTYHKQPKGYDDEQSSGRSGKQLTKKGKGLKTLNSYVDEDYDDPFDDDFELTDEIQIQHTKNTP